MHNLLKRKAFFTALTLTVLISRGQSPVSAVLEYMPAPGQFVNTSIGGPSAAENFEKSETGFITLGGFGGYIIFKMTNPILNDPENPYGIDYSIMGNASVSSSEPAVVWVMTDSNQNGLPDDTWFLLAGSDYWFNSSIHNYQITWFNPNAQSAADVRWEDNQGGSGYLNANEFHTQPYYPLADSFPDIDQEKFTLAGEYIHHRIDTTNPMLIVTRHYPFGYVDNTPKNVSVESNLPDNPYSNKVEGFGGDSFDLSWAIDKEGNYVKIEKVDFIKIQNAVNYNYGRIGELSTEITQIIDVEPNSISITDTALVALEPVWNNVVVDSHIQMHACYFSWGKMQPETIFNWSAKPNDLATIDQYGTLISKAEGKITVYVSVTGSPEIMDSTEIIIDKPVTVHNSNLSQMAIYPNPASDFIYLSGSYTSNYFVIDIAGKVVQKGKMDNDKIDISELEPGVYHFVLDNNEKWNNKKFIKQ